MRISFEGCEGRVRPAQKKTAGGEGPPAVHRRAKARQARSLVIQAELIPTIKKKERKMNI